MRKPPDPEPAGALDERALDAIAAAVKRRHARRAARRRELWAEAEADARRIVTLCAEAGARRVHQWGSILEPTLFREYSDIDVAVEGLPDVSTLFRLQERAEALTRFRVHLVELERIEPEYRESILERGRVVYERGE